LAQKVRGRRATWPGANDDHIMRVHHARG
jgi:hypothetical protein